MGRDKILEIAACTSLAASFLTMISPARAASLASDNAADPAYASGWTTGDNGGTGFGAWTISLGTPSLEGAVIASSSINGASPPSGNIDVSGKSWGLYSNTNDFATATRPLTGNLSVGQQILVDFDTGSLSPSGLDELSFTSGNTSRFQLYADGLDTDYIFEKQVSAGNNTTVDSGIPDTTNGLHLDFTLTSADTFSLAVTPSGGSTRNFTGTLTGTSGSGINEIKFTVDDAGASPNADAFINNLAVAVPEPASLALLSLTAALLVPRRRSPAC